MSIIKHVTLQKNVARDFRYDPLITYICLPHVSAREEAFFRRDDTKIYSKEGNVINESGVFLTNVLFERCSVMLCLHD